MSCTGTIIVSFDQCIDLSSNQMTPNEIRATADTYACQMEAIEAEEGWKKNVSCKWDVNLPINKHNARTTMIKYIKRFISEGDFLQELDLLYRNGFDVKMSTTFLSDNDGGGVIWKNEE